jgi:hypothetical protein
MPKNEKKNQLKMLQKNLMTQHTQKLIQNHHEVFMTDQSEQYLETVSSEKHLSGQKTKYQNLFGLLQEIQFELV